MPPRGGNPPAVAQPFTRHHGQHPHPCPDYRPSSSPPHSPCTHALAHARHHYPTATTSPHRTFRNNLHNKRTSARPHSLPRHRPPQYNLHSRHRPRRPDPSRISRSNGTLPAHPTRTASQATNTSWHPPRCASGYLCQRL